MPKDSEREALSPHPLQIVTRHFDEIALHVERHVGPIAHVHHEVVSDVVHLDVLHVPPNRRRPCHTLVTAGMSELAMDAPEGAEECRFAELLVSLPESWPAGPRIYDSPSSSWPLTDLIELARHPHVRKTWVWWGHTVAVSEPPRPLHPCTPLCAWILLCAPTLALEFQRLETDDGDTTVFFSAVPIHGQELALARRAGPDPLVDRFVAHGVTDVIDPRRPAVCGRARSGGSRPRRRARRPRGRGGR